MAKTPKKASKKAAKSARKKAAKKAAKKAPAKKTAKKAPTSTRVTKRTAPQLQRREEKNYLPLVLLVVGFLAVVAGLAYLLTGGEQPQEDMVVATVNGEPIMQSTLDTQYAILPEQYKKQFSRDQVLQQLIDEELIIQYAEEQGVSVSEEQVNQEVQGIVEQGEMSMQQLQQNLDRFNLTIQDFEALIKRKIIIEEGMELVTADVNVSDAEARAYYNENEGDFLQPRQVKVRHILIASQRENAAQLGRDLKQRVEDGEDFCALAKNYTDDKGSKDSCGEYTFGRGQMVPAFENASFTMEEGDVTLIQTQFGYHVIEKLENIPARQLAYEEVSEQIKQQLRQQERLQAYQDFLNETKTDAEITRN